MPHPENFARHIQKKGEPRLSRACREGDIECVKVHRVLSTMPPAIPRHFTQRKQTKCAPTSVVAWPQHAVLNEAPWTEPCLTKPRLTCCHPLVRRVHFFSLVALEETH